MLTLKCKNKYMIYTFLKMYINAEKYVIYYE